MKLVSLTLAALMLAAVVYAATATAQTSAPKTARDCDAEPRDVSLYFERDKVELNSFSKVMVERVATEAKACGLGQVYAETRLDSARATAISNEFQAKGIRMIVVGSKAAAPAGEDVAARSARMRLTLASRIG